MKSKYKHVVLDDIATISSGGTPSRSNPKFWNGNIPWVKTTHIQNCIINEQDINEWITEEGLQKSSAKMIPAGTILMAMYGQGKTRGQVSILNLDASINQACAAIELKSEVHRDYIYQSLLASYSRIRAMSNTGGQENLSAGLIKDIPLTLFSLPEQKAIADLLTTWDNAIEKTEKLIQAKKELLNGFYQQLLIPKKSQKSRWIKVKIGELLTPRNKKAIPTDNRPLFSLTIENGVTAKTDRYNREALVKDSGSKKYKIVCPNDIVFNPANLRWGAIACSKVPNDVVVSPIYEVLMVKDDKINIDFLTHLLMSPRQIGIYATKTEGTLIERMAVKLDAFLLLDICIPEKRCEQQRIADILNTAQQEIDLLKQLAEKYKTQKRGLMQKMLTGIWRIKPEIINKYKGKQN